MAKTDKVGMRKLGVRGARTFFASEKVARALEGTGRYERYPAQAPGPRREEAPEAPVVEPEVPVIEETPEIPEPTDEYDGMSYWELRRLATERGLAPEGNKKDDYVKALRYQTRMMQADE